MEFLVRKKIEQLMKWMEEGHITFSEYLRLVASFQIKTKDGKYIEV
jgi:hypothetical protein